MFRIDTEFVMNMYLGGGGGGGGVGGSHRLQQSREPQMLHCLCVDSVICLL